MAARHTPGPTVALDDLVDGREIGKRMHVAPTLVHQWARRHEDFPQPVIRSGNRFLWSWTAVTAWYAKREKMKHAQTVATCHVKDWCVREPGHRGRHLRSPDQKK